MQIPQIPAKNWQRLIQRLAATRPGSWILSRLLPNLDRVYSRLRDGKGTLTEALAGLPVVYVTSYGSVSGQPRVCPLVALPDDERLILIATNFGSKRHPSWYHNLRKRPEAVVYFDGMAARYNAREAHGEDRERIWANAVRRYAGYQAYAERSGGRRIPVMVLEPAEERTWESSSFGGR